MSIPIRTAISAAATLGVFSSVGTYYYTKPAPLDTTHLDSRPFQLLSAQEIDQRLSSSQFATTLNTHSVKTVYTNQIASNNPVEDNYSIHSFNKGLIAGVYDGHIGPQCSRLVKKQLPVYIARELSNDSLQPEEAISNAFVDLDYDIQQRFYNLFPNSIATSHEKDIREALKAQPDKKLSIAAIEEAIHGSCALTVYIKDNVVYSANTGDSRVVIVGQDEQGQWKGRRLVEEQSPANPEWKQHLLSQHPTKESKVLVMKNRIFGCIAVGGSFGDIMYKVPVEYQMKVLPFIPYEIYRTFAHYHHRIVTHYRTPPYLESRPLLTKHTLEKGDRFIILGTDGLWDELSWDDCRSTDGDQVAADIMSRWNRESNPATHLTRQALLHDAVYKNLKLKEPVTDQELELSKRLTRSPSRRYRDDITISVIELNPSSSSLPNNIGPIVQAQEVDLSVPRVFDPSLNQGTSWVSGWLWPFK